MIFLCIQCHHILICSTRSRYFMVTRLPISMLIQYLNNTTQCIRMKCSKLNGIYHGNGNYIFYFLILFSILFFSLLILANSFFILFVEYWIYFTFAQHAQTHTFTTRARASEKEWVVSTVYVLRKNQKEKSQIKWIFRFFSLA